MPAGRFDGPCAEALKRGDALAVLEPLKEQFDFVIVDAAAQLPPSANLRYPGFSAVAPALARRPRRVSCKAVVSPRRGFRAHNRTTGP